MVAKQPGQPTDALLAEIERLNKVVKTLEEERAHDRQAIAKLQDDVEFYKHALLNELKKSYSEEQLRRWADEDDIEGLSFSEMIAQLELAPDSAAQSDCPFQVIVSETIH